MTRKTRVEIYRTVLDQVAARLPETRILNVHVNKVAPRYSSTKGAADIETMAWEWFIQRFETFLQRNGNAHGVIFADDTNEVKIRRLVRKMRVYNYVPSMFGSAARPVPLTQIVEDPVMRDSRHSYFIQVADLAAHALYRKLYPKGGYRRYGVDRLFDRLDPILLKEASRTSQQGIVEL